MESKPRILQEGLGASGLTTAISGASQTPERVNKVASAESQVFQLFVLEKSHTRQMISKQGPGGSEGDEQGGV